MQENKYDDTVFFEKYSQMDRSVKGLDGAGEWHALRGLLPDFKGKRVLDLGCGYGWHCRYAVEQGASSVVGVDISEKMLAEAEKLNDAPNIQYIRQPIENISFPPGSFDVVISSLAFHYIGDFCGLCSRIGNCLTDKGRLVFSVEHPVFTAQGPQQWHSNKQSDLLHWPVDNYFIEGHREATFLGETVVKYHRTLTTYIGGLLSNGFTITHIVEPQPSPQLINDIPGMKDELRRPMMLIISAEKTTQ